MAKEIEHLWLAGSRGKACRYTIHHRSGTIGVFQESQSQRSRAASLETEGQLWRKVSVGTLNIPLESRHIFSLIGFQGEISGHAIVV
jgi:ligand-binding sensor domain-containing protein